MAAELHTLRSSHTLEHYVTSEKNDVILVTWNDFQVKVKYEKESSGIIYWSNLIENALTNDAEKKEGLETYMKTYRGAPCSLGAGSRQRSWDESLPHFSQSLSNHLICLTSEFF